MAAEPKARPRVATIVTAATAIVALAGVSAAAVLSPGYDVQDVPRVSTAVWVIRDDGAYARVDTELHEFDSVNAIAEPTAIVQRGDRGLAFTQGYVQSWDLNPASPADLVASDGGAAALSSPSPAATDRVTSAGSYVLYETGTGEIYLGAMPTDGATQSPPFQLNPFADDEVPEGEDPPRYAADAAATDAEGRVVMYSGAEGGVREFTSRTGRFQGSMSAVPQAPEAGTDLSMVMVGGHWVMYSPADGLVWIEGLDHPVETGLGADALLQDGASDADRVVLADATGLIAIAVSDGAVTRLADAAGRPAAPVVVGGITYAAWLDTTGGSLWTSEAGETTPLEVDLAALADVRTVTPVFQSNGDRVVLTETATGMVWTLPDAQLLSLDGWDSLDGSEQLEGTVQVDDVLEQQPPVAADDVFGVRRGALVLLPVLLNDSDPNKKDVLTIDPASVGDIADPGFGQLGLVEDDQQLVVRVSAPSGSSTFTYAVTDGYSSSEPATVTLTVVPDDQNSAPVWCPMEDCTQPEPRLQVAPGGYARLAVLPGWVDPEGDPIALVDARAKDPQAPVTVVPTTDGTIVVRHLDPNAGEATIPLTVTVSDSRGASTDMDLDLRVTAAPSLVAKPLAYTAAAGEHRVMELSDGVSGGSGSYRLVDASASGDDGLTVVPSSANGTIDLSASAPGEYAATYTVEDTRTLAQQTAVIRLTVPPTTSVISASPLTAFVRPGEDTTLDVLSSVRSSSGRVLIVQSALTDSPDLSVSVVDQSYVRVSATTTVVEPGPIGVADVVIADGAGSSVATTVSVFLLQPTHGVGPVAAPDAISVRAGEQVDIPVLANDASPRGERLLLHPGIEGSGAAGELAFASGDMLRYLAPDVAGVYTLSYSAYLESDASRLDTATVTVTVLPAGSNRPPQPPTLTARVVAGQSVRIPVPAVGADPDGDSVVVTDVTQPEPGSGVATVSASGAAVTYRAPSGGVPGGQVTFTYVLADSSGETATGSVRVGVLDAAPDVAPVTYSDYVAVQRGSKAPITVAPLLNDRDPQRGELKLIDVRPNAIKDSDEWARLQALIDNATSLDDGVVVLHAGDLEGAHSFVYTVESQSSFSTATGLIVLDVSDNPAPDGMQITDTVITAQNRNDLAGGIDVVTGKVQWPTGDVSSLRLSLWGDAAQDFVVEGNRISGDLPTRRTVVPFALTGTDATGAEVTSYGFLRIPAFDDLRLQLRGDIAPLHVGEEKSVDFAMRDLLAIAPTDVIDVRQDDSFAVQRDNAVCTPTGLDGVTYAAGREAPWTDTCSVAVRLDGQDTWSIVAVPIAIEPKDPLAILSPVSRTITPGDQDSVALIEDMISWEGGRVGDVDSLRLATSYAGSSFEVVQTGDSVAIQAFADAKPGTRETIIVESSAFGGLRSAITLTVGPALPDSPKGATFTQVCDVSKGPQCLITAVGLPTEYDPYFGKPHSGLTLESVGTGGGVDCAVATVRRLSETQMVATWPTGAKPLGGECVVDFVVADAQGKTGPGRVSIDVQGYPPTPQSITTASYTGSSVTLAVALGQAALTHPAVSGVTIWEHGSQVAADCAPGANAGVYRCVIGGLVNGDQHEFTAKAVNAVGESAESSAVTSWAYQPPTIQAMSAVPAYNASVTSTEQGVATLTIEAADDVASFRIENTNATVASQGAVTTTSVNLPVGSQTIRVMPISQFRPPISGSNEGTQASTSVTVAGSPYFAGQAVGHGRGTSIDFESLPVQANYSDLPLSTLYVAWPASNPNPSCTMDGAGQAAVSGPGAVTSTTTSITGLEENVDFKVGVCGSNGYGSVFTVGSATVTTWVAPDAPDPAGSHYTVGNSFRTSGGQWIYDSVTPPSFPTVRKMTLYYWYNNSRPSTTFSLSKDSTDTITATYCLSHKGTQLCGPATLVEPTDGSAPTIVTVSKPGGCLPLDQTPSKDDFSVSSGVGYANYGVTDDGSTYTFSFAGPFQNLQSFTVPINWCPPPPDPDPTTPPTAGP